MTTGIKGNDFVPLTGTDSYIGTKIIHARQMNRLEYNNFRGWECPQNEDPADEGYIVQYADGYISWSPAKQFKEAYRPCNGMSFGLAYEAMLQGHKVARAGWNGKGMFIFNVPGSIFEVNRAPLLGIYPAGTVINYHSHVDMKTADDRVVPWLCSQTDMAAIDWQIVE